MREGITWLFCIAALAMLTLGKAYAPPDLFRAYEAFSQASEREDWRRAAQFGEKALLAAETHELIDETVRQKMVLKVARAQEKAGNWQRASGLYQAILQADNSATDSEIRQTAAAGLTRIREVQLGFAFRGSTAPAPPNAAPLDPPLEQPLEPLEALESLESLESMNADGDDDGDKIERRKIDTPS